MKKLALILVLCLAACVFGCVHAETAWDVKVTPEGPDSRMVKVKLPGMERLTSNYHGDRVKLIFRMSRGWDVCQQEEFLVELEKFDDENSCTVELPYFAR